MLARVAPAPRHHGLRSVHQIPPGGLPRPGLLGFAIILLIVTAAAGARPVELEFYWSLDCPHCERARPLLTKLEEEFPDLVIERFEIRSDRGARQQFIRRMNDLGIRGAGVPAFVIDNQAVIGFRPGSTEGELRHRIETARATASGGHRSGSIGLVHLPVFGAIDPESMPFPAFTVAVGLVDGLNPCAMWVLLVMLGVLMHVRSRARLALFGGTFLFMSGVVYFLFMTAWTFVFRLTGVSTELTRLLGVALVAIGLINLKEIFWFKRGVSLMVPDRVKPGLFRRMRSIAAAASLPAALVGIAVLAFVVNLIELGCTIGLPVVYTRILSLRENLGWLGRYGYLALYNLAYVVPLGLVVLAYALTLHRIALTERGAGVLKAFSGVLLISFGVLFLLAPQVLGG